MAFKLIRHVGLINATTLGDDAAHSIDCGKLSAGAAYRVSSLNANDVCIKLSMEGTAATATNGITMNGGSSIMIVPDEKQTSVSAISATNANPAVFTVNNGHGFVVGDQVGMTDCATAGWNTLITNGNITAVTYYEHGRDTITVDKNSTSTGAFPGGTLHKNFSISAINHTAGSDGWIVVEEVVQVGAL